MPQGQPLSSVLTICTFVTARHDLQAVGRLTPGTMGSTRAQYSCLNLRDVGKGCPLLKPCALGLLLCFYLKVKYI